MGNYIQRTQTVTVARQEQIPCTRYTPLQYDHTVYQLENNRRLVAKWQQDLSRPDRSKDAQARLNVLYRAIETDEGKLAKMNAFQPDICRRYPGKKPITLTFEYDHLTYSVKVDINDSMDCLIKNVFASATRHQLPFNYSLAMEGRLHLYQEGAPAILPSQRWLIPYEEKQSLHYIIQIDPLTTNAKVSLLQQLHQEARLQHKIIETTDDQLIIQYDQWYIFDTTFYTRSDPSRIKRFVSEHFPSEPGYSD